MHYSPKYIAHRFPDKVEYDEQQDQLDRHAFVQRLLIGDGVGLKYVVP